MTSGVIKIFHRTGKRREGWYFGLFPAGAWEPILTSAKYESAERAHEVAVIFNRTMYPAGEGYTVRKPRKP
jgi:hypothetical protein